MRTKIIEIIDNEIARHKNMSERYLSCIYSYYDKKYSLISLLVSLIKPNKIDIKSCLENYRYCKHVVLEFEIMKSVVSHEIQRLVKQKKSKQTIKAKVLEMIGRKMNVFSQCMKSSQTDSTEYEQWLQLYYDYNNIKQQIEKIEL